MDTIGICNMAIGLVGASSILSLADETLEAEECGLYYDNARRVCLENRDWTFASTTAKLAQDAVAVSTEFTYSYTLPSKCLVVRAVSDSADLLSAVTYQRSGNAIVSNSATIYIKYTEDVTNVARFSPSFTTATAHKLAEFIAPKLTGDKALKKSLNEEAEDLMENGGAIDGMQGSPKRAYASRLLKARFGGSYRYGTGSTLY